MLSPVAPLQHFDFVSAASGADALTAFSEAVVAAIDKDGAAVVHNALTAFDCDTIVAEMRPFLDASAFGHESFSGARTKRTGALAARSSTSHKALAHPLLMRVCDAVLGAQCLSGDKVQLAYDAAGVAVAPLPASGRATSRPRYPWQLHLTQIIDIGPGEKAQSIHRDRWAFLHNFQGTEVEISTMWALTEFSEANGATRIVPGSHRWDERALTSPISVDDTTCAAMPKGSLLIYTGSTFHGGGSNRTSERRVGLNVDYNLAFLRQEENQYLSAPPHIASKFPEELQRLLGYTQGGGALGYFADLLPPKLAFKGFDVTVPGGGLAKM